MILQLDNNTERKQASDDSFHSSFNIHDSSLAKKPNQVYQEGDFETGGSASEHSLNSFFSETTSKCEEKTEKKVCFHEKVEIRHIPNRYDTSEEERAMLWESADSLRDIKIEVRAIVDLIDNGFRLTLELGQRGLKHFCNGEKEKRSRIRQDACEAVFRMQDLQEDLWTFYEDSGDITEFIGRYYAHLTEESRKVAMIRAMSDHAAASDML